MHMCTRLHRRPHLLRAPGHAGGRAAQAPGHSVRRRVHARQRRLGRAAHLRRSALRLLPGELKATLLQTEHANDKG